MSLLLCSMVYHSDVNGPICGVVIYTTFSPPLLVCVFEYFQTVYSFRKPFKLAKKQTHIDGLMPFVFSHRLRNPILRWCTDGRKFAQTTFSFHSHFLFVFYFTCTSCHWCCLIWYDRIYSCVIWTTNEDTFI